MKGNHFGLLPPHKPALPTPFLPFLSDMFKASERQGMEIWSQLPFPVLFRQLLAAVPSGPTLGPPFSTRASLPLLPSCSGATALELALFPFLEPTVWSQRGLSASLGSANKLGSGGHTAGDLEA